MTPTLHTSGFALRPLDERSDAEIDIVVARTIDTVVGTIPEFEGSLARARDRIPNLTADQMRAMYEADFPKPTHNFLVAEAEGALIGHSIYFLRRPEDAPPFGYLFTRYVVPRWRHRGVGTAMLEHALEWYRAQHAAHVSAHTHPTNAGTRALLSGAGFTLVETLADPWPSLHFKLELDGGKGPDAA